MVLACPEDHNRLGQVPVVVCFSMQILIYCILGFYMLSHICCSWLRSWFISPIHQQYKYDIWNVFIGDLLCAKTVNAQMDRFLFSYHFTSVMIQCFLCLGLDTFGSRYLFVFDYAPIWEFSHLARNWWKLCFTKVSFSKLICTESSLAPFLPLACGWNAFLFIALYMAAKKIWFQNRNLCYLFWASFEDP